jgi:hypothetical protein
MTSNTSPTEGRRADTIALTIATFDVDSNPVQKFGRLFLKHSSMRKSCMCYTPLLLVASCVTVRAGFLETRVLRKPLFRGLLQLRGGAGSSASSAMAASGVMAMSSSAAQESSKVVEGDTLAPALQSMRRSLLQVT